MTRPRAVAMAVVVMVGIGASACSGSDDEPNDTAARTVPTDTVAATSGNGDDPGDTAGDVAATMTGEEICERLSISSVSADLGLEILTAEPDDTDTPQCAYTYQTGTGGISNLTVAAMRPEDVGGATGQEAFDAVVEINQAIAGDDADHQVLDAGDGAVRLSGAALHLGILRLGDHVYTAIVPAADADADDVDRLIVSMATALAEH